MASFPLRHPRPETQISAPCGNAAAAAAAAIRRQTIANPGTTAISGVIIAAVIPHLTLHLRRVTMALVVVDFYKRRLWLLYLRPSHNARAMNINKPSAAAAVSCNCSLSSATIVVVNAELSSAALPNVGCSARFTARIPGRTSWFYQ